MALVPAAAGVTTTCDIYRTGRAPPAAPDVASVSCKLIPADRGAERTGYYTHLLLVEATVDIRDGYAGSVPASGLGTGYDTVYVPDKNSAVKYAVAEVRRVGRGTDLDHKRVYLLRQTVTWPSNDV